MCRAPGLVLGTITSYNLTVIAGNTETQKRHSVTWASAPLWAANRLSAVVIDDIRTMVDGCEASEQL